MLNSVSLVDYVPLSLVVLLCFVSSWMSWLTKFSFSFSSVFEFGENATRLRVVSSQRRARSVAERGELDSPSSLPLLLSVSLSLRLRPCFPPSPQHTYARANVLYLCLCGVYACAFYSFSSDVTLPRIFYLPRSIVSSFFVSDESLLVIDFRLLLPHFLCLSNTTADLSDHLLHFVFQLYPIIVLCERKESERVGGRKQSGR